MAAVAGSFLAAFTPSRALPAGMGTGRRGSGAYRPPADMWELHKRKAYWTAAGLTALVLGLWLADTSLRPDE